MYKFRKKILVTERAAMMNFKYNCYKKQIKEKESNVMHHAVSVKRMREYAADLNS